MARDELQPASEVSAESDAPPREPSASGRRRPVIAVLIHYIEQTTGGYEQVLRHSFVAACQRHDFDFVLLCGSPLEDPIPEQRIFNEVFALVDERHFDGVVIIPAGLCRFTSLNGLLERLFEKRLACCSLGMVVEGVPSIVAENETGMRAAVEHLVVEHGRTNLAFLGASWPNVDVDCRREVFLEVMARHGIAVPPHRLLGCWLEASTAEAAVMTLLEQDPGVDAIVAANDGAAFGAMRAVTRSGSRVAEQISLTGYDDLPLAQLTEPSLTTVSQPLEAMAAAAIDCIALQLSGGSPALVTKLPSTFIVRHSCGCQTRLAETMSREELVEAARHAYTERLHSETMFGRILELARILSVATNRAELERLTTERLSTIGVGDCFLGLYADSAHTQMRSLMPRRCAEARVTLNADASFLDYIGNPEKPRALLVLGLAYRSELLGMLAFDLDGRSVDYQAIAAHLAGAWQLVALREQVVHQTMLTERSLQERQAAADRSRATSALAGGVAHDLNNALGSLVSLSDVVCDEIGEHQATGRPITREVVDDLRTIKSSALRAAETIKDLMTLGRIGRTRQEPFDLVRLARHIIEDQRIALSRAQSPGITLSLEASEADLIVAGSEPHVERAIGNVLRNAIEAVSRGGDIEMSVSSLVVEQRLQLRESVPPGTYAVVSVSDNGSGIDDEAQRRVFEPFFSTKRLGESSGSGLGLAIVHSVVKEHHGYLDVTSQVGQGSRFTLYFPRADVVPEHRPSIPPVCGGSARILVIDDDLTQLRTANRVLSRCGYDVTTMASGARAYDVVALDYSQDAAGANSGTAALASRHPASSSFDLLILDLALNEELDGLQIFKKIRALFPGQKGILASGHAFVDHEEEIRAADLVWLPKPYTAESLTAAIRAALRE